MFSAFTVILGTNDVPAATTVRSWPSFPCKRESSGFEFTTVQSRDQKSTSKPLDCPVKPGNDDRNPSWAFGRPG